MTTLREKRSRFLLPAIVVLGSVLVWSAQAFAQVGATSVRKETILGVGLHGFFAMGQKDNYPRDPVSNQRLEAEANVLYGGSIVYGYLDRAVVFSVGQLSTTLRNGENVGDLHIMPFLVTGQWRLYERGRSLVPFIGLGAGAYRIRFNPSPNFAARLVADTDASGVPLMNPEMDIGDAIGIHGAAGFEWLLGKRIGLLTEVQYHIFRTHARIDGTMEDNGKLVDRSFRKYVRLDMPLFGAAIRVYF